MVNVLLSKGEVNLPLGWCPRPIPRSFGYLDKHAKEVFARRCAIKSRDAFVLLMALCSWAISLIGTSLTKNNEPQWVDLLLQDDPTVQPSWIEDLIDSVIVDFKIYRVSSFMKVGTDEDLKHTLMSMLRGNVPVWFYW